MPTYNNTKLPPLSPSVANPLPLRKTQKQFPADFQDSKTRPNLRDHTGRFISLGKGKKNA